MFKKESQKLRLLRLLTAQLIAVCLLILVLTQAIFKS
ncbi:putative immunity protein, partial [Streptococcus mutans M2A]